MFRSVSMCLGAVGLVAAVCLPARAAKLNIDTAGLDDEQETWFKDCRKGGVDACVSLGEALAGAGRHADAVAVLSSVTLPQDDGEALAQYAAELAEVGRGDEALEYRTRACDQAHGESCLVLADSYTLPDQLDDALTAWSKACQHGAADGCTRRAHALRDALRLDQAIQAFQRLCPDQPEACAYAGELLMVRGRHKEAARVLAQGAVDLAATEALLPGHLNLLEDDPGGADAAYLAACQGGSHTACVTLAELRLREERVDDAIAAYELSCDSCDSSCLDWGTLLARQDRVDDAIAAYGKACVADQCSDGCTAAVELAAATKARAKALDQMTVLCKMEGAEWGDSPATAACYDAGMTHQDAGNVDLAGELFEVGCEAGDPRSCKELLAKQRRKGEFDADKLENACFSMGSDCVRGGLLHEAGRDTATAEKMFAAACNVGITTGCQALAALMQRQGRGREAAAVAEKAGLTTASASADDDGQAAVEFTAVARRKVTNATGQSATLDDLRGEGVLVLYMAEPWPCCYPPMATLAALPDKLDETPLTVVALAESTDDAVVVALATRAAGSELALRFAELAPIRNALGATDGTVLWVVDTAGVVHPVETPLVIGDDAGLLATVEVAIHAAAVSPPSLR